MLLLVTGASGAGKSTARQWIAEDLGPDVVCVELHDVAGVPAVPTLAWRQQATEAAVRRAHELEVQGRHLLLAGDPVAAGEIVAAPSAHGLEGVAVLLLDLDRQTQRARLCKRGDDPTLLVHHIAFADWMRAHATDPTQRLEVLQTNGWDQMRWHRCHLLRDEGLWSTTILETSRLSVAAVAAETLRWSRDALAGQAPIMRVPA